MDTSASNDNNSTLQPNRKRKNLAESIECDIKSNDFEYTHEIYIKTGNIQWTQMIALSLMPDKELNDNKSSKIMTFDEDLIHVVFKAIDWKTLRVSISSFYTNVELCLKTIEKFENY